MGLGPWAPAFAGETIEGGRSNPIGYGFGARRLSSALPSLPAGDAVVCCARHGELSLIGLAGRAVGPDLRASVRRVDAVAELLLGDGIFALDAGGAAFISAPASALACCTRAAAASGLSASEAPLRRSDLPWLVLVVLSGGAIEPVLLMIGAGGDHAGVFGLLAAEPRRSRDNADRVGCVPRECRPPAPDRGGGDPGGRGHPVMARRTRRRRMGGVRDRRGLCRLGCRQQPHP